MTEFEEQVLALTERLLEKTEANACPQVQVVRQMEKVVTLVRDLRSIMVRTDQLSPFAKEILVKLYAAADAVDWKEEKKPTRGYITDRVTTSKKNKAA